MLLLIDKKRDVFFERFFVGMAMGVVYADCEVVFSGFCVGWEGELDVAPSSFVVVEFKVEGMKDVYVPGVDGD